MFNVCLIFLELESIFKLLINTFSQEINSKKNTNLTL